MAGQTLTPTSVFAIFAYAKAFVVFTKYLGKRLGPFLDCNMSVGRIQTFLQTVERSSSDSSSNSTNEKIGKCLHKEDRDAPSNECAQSQQQLRLMVSLTDVSCKYNEDEEKYLLKNVSLRTERPQNVLITGPIGSGKSSLLLTILRELSIFTGNLERRGKMAFVGQSPWVFSGTLHDNITFHRPFDATKFQTTVEACALRKDIEQFPDGDLTTIGERGVVLSGGQKARVSMARALYSNADIYLLDDPLSSVDAIVGRHIFEKYICNALRDRLCLLVTHQPCYLKHADHIVVMSEGSIGCQGSYLEIANMKDVIPGLEKIFDEENFHKNASIDLLRQEKRELESYEETSLTIPKEDRNFGVVSYKPIGNTSELACLYT